MTDWLSAFVYLLLEMAPYLLLGFLIAGLLHAFVPQGVYRRWLGGDDVKSVLLSIAFGVPLPLCSCGVIPTAVSMRKEGASKGATTAFLIATPQTGVDSIAATWSVLGLPFAIMRPIVAIVTGFFGGMAANIVSRREKKTEGRTEESSSTPESCPAGETSHPKGFLARCREALVYGFGDMIMDIGRWLVIGLVLAGLITIFVPDDFFTSYAGHELLNMLLILVVAAPMYVCATGSIPIAAALILKGLSPGAALVFLMAGPATNLASMMVLGRTLGRRSLVVYLVSIVLGAVCFGLLVDCCLPAEWFTSSIKTAFHSSCCHEAGSAADSGASWIQIASSILLVVLLVIALIRRFVSHKHKKSDITMKTYIVKGMMCNHCKANVESHIAALEGVKSVTVDLASGKVDVEGNVEAEKVIELVKSLGYDCSAE